MMAISKRQGYSTAYKKKKLTSADRLSKHLHRAFKGKIAYQWSYKDKLARVEWQGPNPPGPRRKPKTSQTKK